MQQGSTALAERELGAFGLHTVPNKKLVGGDWLVLMNRHRQAGSLMQIDKSASTSGLGGWVAGWLGGWVTG